MRKQFLRVKQIADQTFLRAEKTEVLTEDLLNAEKRVDTIKQSCQNTGKKIASCHIDFGSEVSSEKKLKKVPQVLLAASMQENGNCFSKNSILGTMLHECSPIQAKLGSELLEYYNEVDKSVLKPIIGILENEVHGISKLRKQLAKLTLDMDSARTRFQTAERHNNQTTTASTAVNSTGKLDVLKDEMEDASQKVDQCRDALAAEMFSLIAKEPQISQLYLQLHQLQATYHRNSLLALEASIPHLESLISDFFLKPVYGCSLEEHLRVTNRNVAQVIETCIDFLLEYGISEEGLLRIAGSASKLKKLKSAFDAGLEVDMAEYIRDPHAVSGALKSYLRELPEPLMTYVLYEEWMSAAKIPDFETRLQSLWQVVHKLPEQNFCNLQYVIKFLSKLHENMDINKMSSQNIAIVIAPNLIWSPVENVNSTFGMNMSTANLHSSIVETLISYADWFFPESEFLFSSKSFDNSELVQSNAVDQESDENVNLSPTDVNPNAGTQSPKVFPRSVKKPVAPAPPTQRLVHKEKVSEGIAPIVTPDLMDLNSDTESTADPDDIILRNKVSSTPVNLGPDERPEIINRTSVIRRRSNEHVSHVENPVIAKQEKPCIPEKPTSYGTYSLDRKSRPVSVSSSSRSTDRLPDIVQRSHVERPSVPPPERPAKPSRFSSVEISTNSEKLKPAPRTGKVEQFGLEFISSNAKSPDPVSPCSFIEDREQLNETIKMEVSSPSQAHSRTKQNRFDFLVAQTTEKPPERPPRSVPSAPDLTELVKSSSELCDQGKEVENQLKQKFPEFPASASGGTGIANFDERSDEVLLVSKQSVLDLEKQKPPRPQPPMPHSKPKTCNITENTSL